ncbi:hypothetical protein BKA70DRAFT_266649 [Coprinopsis sp. MPI-PUGE-AT-0042]|nr:hypothetical protein BKA70DRAFT_266649 [Coprinopsis sp. MPI-PUGE-AT-0042]
MPEDDTPLAERLVPKRTAAKQASTAWKDLSSSDEEADVDLAAKKRRKSVALRGRKRTGSTARPAATKRKAKATVEVPSTPGPSTPKAEVGRGQDPVDTGSYFGGSIAPGMDYDSDLTPLPSPERDPVKASGALSASLKAQVQEHPMFASFSSDTAPLVLSSRPKGIPETPKPLGTRRKPAAQKKAEDWSLDSLGRHVWVLLDGKDNRGG